MITTGLIIAAAFTFLAWGFYRALPFGKLGVVAWLQTVVLMVPWLLLYGLIGLGVGINLAGILFILVTAIAIYIGLGRWLRSLAETTGATLPHQRSGRSHLSDIPVSSSDHSTLDPDLETESSTPEGTVSEGALLTMPSEDLNKVKGIFGIDTFFATEFIPYKRGVICRGNLRGEAAAVHRHLSERLQEVLPDQYRLFIVPNSDSKPVMIVLPQTTEPISTTLSQNVLAGILFLATCATCLETSSILQGFSFLSAPGDFQRALPIGIGILIILVCHDLGHRWMAARYKAQLSPPFFIPAWQLGAFGSIVRIESFLKTRQELFDIAIAGPAFSGILSLLALVIGFFAPTGPSTSFQVPSLFFQGSILVGSLARVFLGDQLQADFVMINPLVIIGWLGLIITAINLMPAGQLDGGRIVQSIYGVKVAGRCTWITLIVLGLVAIANPLALYWALIIIFLQRDLERPSLDEVSEPDDLRAALGLLALFLMAATLIPLAPGLAGQLGIGG
ncbi:site-2 protease family protein [Candidatus Synechococcus calcipolaris G9]|uniref:Site-2 protease family protein n=1 Tax=Candidatus Synechococcus calcipolaris G9 TaxID=1497997 RepID=A0ABT6F2R8_9SYNE|nr:site-2 protease family protein [Candidatus Synechococcus calcipolaris]MDG2992134.1 site-2 protease family protein [Candidatus Synechococcus calcipolaris G9]